MPRPWAEKNDGISRAGQVGPLQEDSADFLWTRTFSAGTRLFWVSQKSRRRCQSGQQRSSTWSPAGKVKVALSFALSMLGTASPQPSPETQTLTNEAQAFLGPGDGHIYLVGVHNKAQKLLEPALGWPLVHITPRACSDCAHYHIAPLTPWEAKRETVDEFTALYPLYPPADAHTNMASLEPISPWLLVIEVTVTPVTPLSVRPLVIAAACAL